MDLRSEAVTPQSEGSGPTDPREALRRAVERLSGPFLTHSDLLVALSDVWVAEAGLEALLAESDG